MKDMIDVIADAVFEHAEGCGLLIGVDPNVRAIVRADMRAAAFIAWNKQTKDRLVDIALTLAKHGLALMQQGRTVPGAGYNQPQGMPQYIIFGKDPTKDLVFYLISDLAEYVRRQYPEELS